MRIAHFVYARPSIINNACIKEGVEGTVFTELVGGRFVPVGAQKRAGVVRASKETVIVKDRSDFFIQIASLSASALQKA